MSKRCLFAFWICSSPVIVAQNPQLAPEDIRYTGELMAQNHLIAHVELDMGKQKYVRYQYDRYPDVKRITIQNGSSFAERKGESWIESEDWGKTGTAVDQSKAADLTRYVTIAELPFAPTEQHDQSQGAVVWKLIKHVPGKEYQFYTYEESRERPRPGRLYPRFTFIKYNDDPDGHLVLEHFSGNLIKNDELLPVEIGYESLILLPENTAIKIVPSTGPHRPQTKDGKEP